MSNRPRRKPWLRVLLALGVAACGPGLIDDDGEERFRRCTFVLGTGMTADGHRVRTDSYQDYTHRLCTCSTDEENLDLSAGGYRDYINELGFEYCKELAAQVELVTDDCEEKYERKSFGLNYGHPPLNAEEPPSCDDSQAAGCQG